MTHAVANPAAADPTGLRPRYVEAMLIPDGRAAQRVADDGLAAGLSASDLYLEVIAPAMHEIGRLWETARISVAQEHLSTQITQSVIAALSLRLLEGEPVGAGRAAVVSASPGERHSLGPQMVADFLEAQGWGVLFLGPDTPTESLVDLVSEREAEVVALSTALPMHLLSVTRTCQLLSQLPHQPYIVVGGRAYGGDHAQARAVGADAFADDPRQLLRLLAARFGPRAAPAASS